jgi:hypothetical protein
VTAPPLTLEAIEDTAARVRSGAWVSDAHQSALRDRYASARAEDAALGVLVAEAWVGPRMRRAQAGLEMAWAREPIALAGEAPVPVDAIENAVTFERNGARRSALWDLACVKAQDHFRPTKQVVEALRERAGELGCAAPSDLLRALGLSATEGVGDGVADGVGDGVANGVADLVLERTEAAYEELDGWALREVELNERVIDARRKVLSFEDRLRSLAQPRASAHIALGDRVAGSARWFSRVGLDGAMRAVVDRVEASSTQSGGVKVRVELEGERVLLLGSEPPSVHGTARIAAAVAEAAFAAMAQLGPARERAGRDRLHRAVWWQLGERLLWAPAFVERELGVDPAHAATVNRAAMHGSLQALRRSAAEAPFVREALEAKNELVVRLRDRTTRALGSVMTPSWTVHIAAAALERRAEAHCFASLVEAVLYERLRDRLDEDWFRNPRSGEVLRAESALMRTGGALPWLIERTGAKDEREAIERGANALGARVSEAFARATR